jgi:hypothetical protein
VAARDAPRAAAHATRAAPLTPQHTHVASTRRATACCCWRPPRRWRPQTCRLRRQQPLRV